MKHEENLQISICNYIRLQYPNVIFNCDLASGMRLSMGQAVRAKKMRSSRGYPDLFIAYPNKVYCGLYIELKRSGIKLKKKNGEWATPHLKEQAEMLEKLREVGFCAEFAVGFEEARKVVDRYMK